MAFDPWETLPIGQTDLAVTRLGFGAAEIGGLYTAVSDDAGEAIVRHAWDLGVRYFDVAPFYGFGDAELRMGRVLRELPRDEFVLSTKVGRLIRPLDHPGIDPNAGNFADAPPRRAKFDYSRDGIRRSVEDSLERLGLDRIDILFIHDPDDYWQSAIDEAYPALAELRAEGTVTAIGAGMNQTEMLTRFVREADIDVLLCAGRYTLLDQGGLDELLPACIERKVSVVIGGIMNSGLLVDPKPTSRFNYEIVPPGVAGSRAPAQGRLRAPRRPAPGRGHPVPARPPGRRGGRGRGPRSVAPRRVPDVHALAHPRRAVGGPRRPWPARRGGNR